MSEIGKYRHLLERHCYRSDGQPGVGLDIASQGDPIVPWAWQLDLPDAEFTHYSGGGKRVGIQLSGHGEQKLSFISSESLDFIASSHFIEDLPRSQWTSLFREWARCLKPGGKLIILVPERSRWRAALARGQSPNCAHHGPEPLVGDIAAAAEKVSSLRVLSEALTDLSPEDYTIAAILQKI